MAASIGRWILFIGVVLFSLFAFNRWIVYHVFDDILRARAIRFQLTCFIVTFCLGMALFNWINFADLFDSHSDKCLKDNGSSIERGGHFRLKIDWTDIANWKRYTVRSASWRGFLMTVLAFSLLPYISFSLLIAVEPYRVGFIFWLCLAVSVQLFFAMIVFHILRLLFKAVCKRARNISKSYTKLVKVLSVVYALSLVSVGFFNTFKTPQIKEVNVPVKGLPTHLEGLTITFVADIHLGPTVGKRSLEKIVHMINYLYSDLVIIGGDLVDGRVDQLGPAVESLEWIKSKYGTYFVTGNHEYYTTDVHNWFTKLQSLGVHILHNSNVEIKGSGQTGVCLAGVDDPTSIQYSFMDHKTDIDGALKSCDRSSPVILVAHQPVTAKEALLSPYRVDLVMSGHTHGGQMFPLTIGAYLFNPYYAGLYRHDDGSHIYVSMGTVYWGFPVRFMTQSEITKITLVSSP